MALGSPVDQIKSRIDIVQLISSYVSGMKKSGRNFWACCPFHSEKTPSFSVNPDQERFKCFGCGVGGDAFAFIMKVENLDFPGALKLLAEKAGVELEDQPRRRDDGGRKQRLLELNAAASLWFHQTLLDGPLGAKALAYVKKRNLTLDTVRDFQLGYAPDSWDLLRTHLLEQGYSIDEQMAVGLLHESERGQPYDRFRNRLMYPIRDAGGHLIAFGGRDLGEDKKSAKFINSPQTELFDKSATLYGLDRAKSSIRTMDRAIVVEGYMDAIMAHQHGVTNAVCSMGTSLTERQVEQIKRLTVNLVLALDPDTAGDIATLRGVEVGEQTFDRELVPVPSVNGLIHLEERLKADIRVMVLPRGQDPDEVIHENVDEWHRLVASAIPLRQYKLDQILAKHDLSSGKDKSVAVSEVAAELRQIPDRVERLHYLSVLAKALDLREADLTVAMSRAVLPVAKRFSVARDSAPAVEAEETAPSTPPSGLPVLMLDPEDYLVMFAIRYLDDADLWRHNLRAEEVSKSENRELVGHLLKRFEQGDVHPDLSEASLPPGLARHVSYLQELGAQEREASPAERATAFKGLVLQVRKRNVLRNHADRSSRLAEDDGQHSQVLEEARGDLRVLHDTNVELGRGSLSRS